MLAPLPKSSWVVLWNEAVLVLLLYSSSSGLPLSMIQSHAGLGTPRAVATLDESELIEGIFVLGGLDFAGGGFLSL
jgi:hypothetical protein